MTTASVTRDVLLMDGSTVRLRRIHPDDAARLRDFFARLSPRSRYMRFHSHVGSLSDEDIRRFTSVDDEHLLGIVATLGEGGDERIIGVGHYFVLGPDTAEVAFAVEDTHQGRGIATQILDGLAQAARERDIETFEAYVLGENKSMMDVFRGSGYALRSALKYGTLHVSFPIQPTEEAATRAEEREKIASAHSLMPFFQPKSVAVIGASRDKGTFGYEIFHNIRACGFTGDAYAVNRSASEVDGAPAYPSVTDIPGEVELAIIVVPAAAVLGVIDDCARKGVRAVVVITAGFGETTDGRDLERQLLEKVRHYGIRMVGPNCMGVLNADPRVSLNATFSPIFPPFGNVGLLSQSGALGLALLDHASSMQIGLSTFVSVGNKADVSGNDVIQYWEQDPATEVILLYLESFGNPRKFARLAPRIAAKKPIVAVKSGRTTAGSRAASSHTGALASVDVAVDALFKQSGVIRVDTLEEMFDVANLLAHQPLPKGRRVAILTNAGGPGILAADRCEAAGLDVVKLSDETVAKMRAILPREASTLNPIDMIASATSEHYAETLRVLLADECVDSVIVIFIPPLVTQAPDVARAIREVISEGTEKTVLACFMMARGAPVELSEGGRSVPSYIFPESAATALAHVVDHAEWRKRPRGIVPSVEVDSEAARAVVDRALRDAGDGEGVWLSPEGCQRVLTAYGIRSTEGRYAATPEDAERVAAEVGFPVAVKLSSPTITHKTDVGGVILDVGDEAGVVQACATIRERLAQIGREDAMDGVIVQPMIEGGVETIVGLTSDKLFGPLIVFGLGGTMVELMKDVQLRIQPLTDADAREMVRSVKGFLLLQGWRGAPPADVAALEEVLLRVSCMAEDLPEIAEMDLNPVRALEPGRGAIVLDARMMLRRP